MPNLPRPVSTGKWRYATGVSGFAILAVGVWRTAAGVDSTSLVAVIVAGALLLISPLIIERVQHVSVGPDGVAFGLFAEVAQLAPRAAQILGRTDLVSLADSYAIVHEQLRSHKEARIAVQDLIVAKASAVAQRQKFDHGEVQQLFVDGAPVVRVLALGLMEGDPSLADATTIRSAIAESASGNEQYHGLILAERKWKRLTSAQRVDILTAVEDARLPKGSGREVIARRLRGDVLEPESS